MRISSNLVLAIVNHLPSQVAAVRIVKVVGAIALVILAARYAVPLCKKWFSAAPHGQVNPPVPPAVLPVAHGGVPLQPQPLNNPPPQPSASDAPALPPPSQLQLPVVFVPHEPEKLTEDQLKELESVNKVRFGQFGALAMLPIELLLPIFGRADLKINQCASKGFVPLAQEIQHAFERSKAEVERLFKWTLEGGMLDRCETLVRNMEQRWDRFENCFYQLNINLDNATVFGNLLKLALRPSITPEARRIILLKMIQVPFDHLNGCFLFKNMLVMMQARNQDQLKEMIFKMFVEIKLMKAHPWHREVPPIRLQDVPYDLLLGWMGELIEKYGFPRKR